MKFKTMAGRIAALVLACTMLLPMAVNAATFSDTAGHWAAEEIEYLVGKKVLDGMGDGTFQPEAQVTRAQFIKMIDETFGLKATRGLPFADVKSTDWYYPYISKAYAQGYLLEYGSRMNPNNPLTREEAAALIARYLELPEDEAVSRTTFADYSDIDSDYRAYVLSAAYAGLFVGDNDGNFSPKRVLKRGEALAILCRAAGTIYSETSTGLDAAAEKGNAVIKAGNITVKNADIANDMIITEGVSSGSVTLYKCKVNGTLTLRGSAKLVLSECEIGKLIVDTGTNTSVSVTLEDDSNVAELYLESTAGIEMKNGTRIEVLTVGENAPRSSVSGSGVIDEAYINSAYFNTTVTPKKYEVADGINANVAGKENASTGFSEAPTISSTTSYDRISFTTAKGGYVYYYYSNTETVPTADEFKNNYSTTTDLKGRISAASGTPKNVETKAVASAAAYTYVTVCFVDSDNTYHKPIVIKRSSGSAGYGFSGDPTITNINGSDVLSAKPLITGKLYYYYTKTATAPQAIHYENFYSLAVTKNFINVSANSTVNTNLAYSATVAEYGYVVLMLVDANGNKQTPFVINRGSAGISAIASGFNIAPTINAMNGYDYFSFNALSAGTLYYYYTTSNAAPTSGVFMSYHGNAGASLSGTINVAQASVNQTYQHSYPMTTQSQYPYVAFMLQTGASSYTPYVVARGGTGNSQASGFMSNPSVINNGNQDQISLTPMYSGNLRFYYTNVSQAPTIAEFEANYSAYLTNAGVPTSAITVNAGQKVEGGFDISKFTGANAFGYVVFMLKSGETSYQPVAVARVKNNAPLGSSGFYTQPVVTATSDKDSVTVQTTAIGTLYYYYSTQYTANMDANTFNMYYMSSGGTSGTAYIGGAYSPVTFTTGMSSSQATNMGYRYVVMMFVPSGTQMGVMQTGVPITVVRSNTSGNNGSTQSGKDFSDTPKLTNDGINDRLTFTPAQNGKIYYYYTDQNVLPDDSEAFNTNYYSKTEGKGIISVTYGRYTDYSLTPPSGATHLIIMLVSESGGSTSSYKPIKLARPGTT